MEAGRRFAGLAFRDRLGMGQGSRPGLEMMVAARPREAVCAERMRLSNDLSRAGSMREFLRFWRQCGKLAKTGTAALARSWWWLLGIPASGTIRYLVGGRVVELILPNHPILDPILDAMLFAVSGYFIICSGAFLIRFANAPAKLLRAETARASELSNHVAQLQSQLASPVPDIVIETRSAVDIIPRRDSGFHIIILDFYVTNRSDFSSSLEIRLKFDFGGGMFLYPDHDDLAPAIIEINRPRYPSIGNHLGRLISLLPRQGVNGYLSYTMPDYDQFIPGIASAFDLDSLTRAGKILEITDHISEVMKAIPIETHGRYSFREIAQES